jgi:hypothetical protein
VQATYLAVRRLFLERMEVEDEFDFCQFAYGVPLAAPEMLFAMHLVNIIAVPWRMRFD